MNPCLKVDIFLVKTKTDVASMMSYVYRLVITKVYKVRMKTIEGQNAYAPSL